MLSEIWDSGAFYEPLLGKAECCRTMQRRSGSNRSNGTKSGIDGGGLVSAVNDDEQNPKGRLSWSLTVSAAGGYQAY